MLLALAGGLSIYDPLNANQPYKWINFIALLIVFGCSCSDWAASALSCRFSLWLGHISFTLYLSHFVIMCSWQSWIIMQLLACGKLSLASIQAISVITTGVWALALAALLAPCDRLGIRLARLSASFVRERSVFEWWDVCSPRLGATLADKLCRGVDSAAADAAAEEEQGKCSYV